MAKEIYFPAMITAVDVFLGFLLGGVGGDHEQVELQVFMLLLGHKAAEAGFTFYPAAEAVDLFGMIAADEFAGDFFELVGLLRV